MTFWGEESRPWLTNSSLYGITISASSDTIPLSALCLPSRLYSWKVYEYLVPRRIALEWRSVGLRSQAGFTPRIQGKSSFLHKLQYRKEVIIDGFAKQNSIQTLFRTQVVVQVICQRESVSGRDPQNVTSKLHSFSVLFVYSRLFICSKKLFYKVVMICFARRLFRQAPRL